MSQKTANGVMLNAYPDSIGNRLSDTITMLQMPEFKDAFSYFYVLPSFFNSDLDRGFSIIDYNINKDLVSPSDLKALEQLQIQLKFDIVLNHLSVASPQFKDLLAHGDNSKYKDFFINWNHFWEGHGQKNNEGIIIPNADYLSKLFMRKSGLPILKVPFPDGTKQPYWNTFYQEITYHDISEIDLEPLQDLNEDERQRLAARVNKAIKAKDDLKTIDFGLPPHLEHELFKIIDSKCSYLGQMDVNAKSELVWEFYEDTLKKLSSYGCKILRLDAFAYLHKAVGASNFFNTPGTWDHLERIKQIAETYQLELLPEIHAEYGLHLHDEVAEKGYTIYDFFLPGLMIHSLETGNNTALLKWLREIEAKGFKTLNMLGCHDGIPVLDLKGKVVNGNSNEGLLSDEAIENLMALILERGGRVKNLYDPSGNKISYYQVNATFFSALGENEHKLLLARAIQLFVPGTPQIWYLDIFAGKNNNKAADVAGSGGHKEINRTNLSLEAIKTGLKTDIVKHQLQLIKLRNRSKAFDGNLSINNSSEHEVDLLWTHTDHFAHLNANLKTFRFSVSYSEGGGTYELEF